LLPLLSDTGNPHTFFWLRKGGTDTGGKAETGARGIVPGDAIGVKNYFEECEVFAQISTTGRVDTVVEAKCSWKVFHFVTKSSISGSGMVEVVAEPASSPSKIFKKIRICASRAIKLELI
jgi:hypothetical protein